MARDLDDARSAGRAGAHQTPAQRRRGGHRPRRPRASDLILMGTLAIFGAALLVLGTIQLVARLLSR